MAQTIRNLLAQDYSNYELQIVVDSATDPVWESLREFEGHPAIEDFGPSISPENL